MHLPDAVSSFLTWLPSLALPFLIAVSGVGALTMALLQAAKTLFPLRQRFYARMVRRWLGEQAAKTDLLSEPTAALQAETDLILLATGGDQSAFYEVPPEQWSALFAATSQIILDDPQAYRSLLLCLAPLATTEDRELLLNSTVEARATAENLTLQRYLDARTRMDRQMQRSTDALQVSLAYRWQRRMQAAALGLNTLILWSAMLWYWYSTKSSVTSRPPVTTITGAVVLALLGAVGGGVLAPVARDLVAVLEQLRSKPGGPIAPA